MFHLFGLQLKRGVAVGRPVPAVALLGSGLCGLQLMQHGVSDGQHHGCGGRIADPHGEEGRDDHEAYHQPETDGDGGERLELLFLRGPVRSLMNLCSQRWTDASQQQDSKGNALMKVPVLHRDGHQQAAYEQHVGVF